MERIIFHIDIDAFFAAVEQGDHPEYAGKPVIVGALPGHRGVVSTCSYEARKFGVYSAMPISRAFELCPKGIYLPVRFERYRELSAAIMRIFGDYTPDMRQMSIDEAFLDMTGTERLFGSPADSARSIKDRVRSETGLTISIGIAPNRYVAKLASERSKPDGLLEVKSGTEADFVARIPIGKLWGIGEKSRLRLEERGIADVATARSYSEERLSSLLGNAFGSFLYSVSRGIDPGVFSEETKSRSLSTETTFERDLVDEEHLRSVLLQMADQLRYSMAEENLRGRTVCLKIRYDDFTTVSIQESLSRHVASAYELFDVAARLLDRKLERGRPVRLIGLGISSVENAEPLADQAELFDGERDKKSKAEKAVFDARKKLSGIPIVRARLLNRPRPKA